MYIFNTRTKEVITFSKKITNKLYRWISGDDPQAEIHHAVLGHG